MINPPEYPAAGARQTPAASGLQHDQPSAPDLSSHLRHKTELCPLVVDRERVAEHRCGEAALRRDREPVEGDVAARRLEILLATLSTDSRRACLVVTSPRTTQRSVGTRSSGSKPLSVDRRIRAAGDEHGWPRRFVRPRPRSPPRRANGSPGSRGRGGTRSLGSGDRAPSCNAGIELEIGGSHASSSSACSLMISATSARNPRASGTRVARARDPRSSRTDWGTGA
jgi:hypothetical protein